MAYKKQIAKDQDKDPLWRKFQKYRKDKEWSEFLSRFPIENRIGVDSSPGSYIINPQICYVTPDWLKTHFSIYHLLNFCSGIDAAILNKRLTSIRSFDLDNPVSRALYGEGILQRAYIFYPDDHELSLWLWPTDDSIISKKWSELGVFQNDFLYDSVWMHAPELYIESGTEVPIVVPPSFVPFYYDLTDLKYNTYYQKLNLSLAQRYKEFSDALNSLRDSVAEKHIRIPPLALEALQKADKVSQLGEIVLDLRKKYSRLRKRFLELEELMLSKEVPLLKKLIEKTKMQKSIGYLYNTSDLDEIEVFSSFALETNEYVFDFVKGGFDLNDINWTKLLEFLVKEAEKAVWRFRLKPLHGTKRRYLNTSNKQISNVVKKLFGYEIVENDIRKVDELKRYMESFRPS